MGRPPPRRRAFVRTPRWFSSGRPDVPLSLALLQRVDDLDLVADLTLPLRGLRPRGREPRLRLREVRDVEPDGADALHQLLALLDYGGALRGVLGSEPLTLLEGRSLLVLEPRDRFPRPRLELVAEEEGHEPEDVRRLLEQRPTVDLRDDPRRGRRRRIRPVLLVVEVLPRRLVIAASERPESRSCSSVAPRRFAARTSRSQAPGRARFEGARRVVRRSIRRPRPTREAFRRSIPG